MSRFVVIYILCYEISAAFSLMIEVKSISNSQILNIFGGLRTTKHRRKP